MSNLTLEERVTRLEEVFTVMFGSLDVEKHKKWLKDAFQESNKLRKAVEASSEKWDDYMKSDQHTKFLELSKELSQDNQGGRAEEE